MKKKQYMNKIEKGTCDKFRTNLLMYSKSKDYETAKNEWSLTCSYNGEDYCICGHAIKNIFEITNIHSGITLNVGEDCIEYFLFDQLGGELAKEQEKCKKLNKLFIFINNLYKRGMIYRFNDVELLNELSDKDYKTISNFFRYGKELRGLSVEEIDKYNRKDYLTHIVKKLCDIYHEKEKQVKCKTYLITNFKLTESQYEKYLKYRNKNILLIHKNNK